MKSKRGIYTPLGLDGCELCHPVRQDDFETINREVDGTPRQSSWKPVPMRLVHEDEGQKLVRSDAPWLGAHALIFRPSAVEALGPMLRGFGELLPLKCEEAEVVVYNPTRVVKTNGTTPPGLKFEVGARPRAAVLNLRGWPGLRAAEAELRS